MAVCGICVEDFSIEPKYIEPISHASSFFVTNHTSGVVATSCGHLFHYYCLSVWLTKDTAGKCPYCKSSIPLKSIIKIYHDWDSSKNEQELAASSQAALTLENNDENFKKTFENLYSAIGSLLKVQGILKEEVKQLNEELLKEKKLSLINKNLLSKSEASHVVKDKQLTQASKCLNMIKLIAIQPKALGILQFSRSLGPLYNPDHRSVLQAVEKMQEKYVSESKYWSLFFLNLL